jgi:hypothetical protein
VILTACDAIVDRALEPQNATGWSQVRPGGHGRSAAVAARRVALPGAS